MESIYTLDPNLIIGRNAYKAILTDADTAKKELIDLLDFEEWRKLKNATPNTTTPTLTPAPTSINTPILSLAPTNRPVD
jgi:hypothetical protein